MSRGTKGPMFLSSKAKAILIVVSVLLILAGIGLFFLATIPGVIVILIGAFVAYLALNSGFAANVGGYTASRKHADRASLYGMHHQASDRLLNPWDAITGKAQPEAKPAAKPAQKADYGQEHYSAASSPDRLSQLEAQYKAGLYSKKEYQQKKRELLRQK